jgi:hypothetical protein
MVMTTASRRGWSSASGYDRLIVMIMRLMSMMMAIRAVTRL